MRIVTPTSPARRILVIDDDNFIRGLLEASLRASDFEVRGVATQAAFGEELVAFDPHVVMVDLDLGPGPSGMQLLALVEADSPWVAKIVVTSHRSTRLVDGNAPAVPDVTYIVKADITSADQIVAAVNASLEGEATVINDAGDAVRLTKGQADVLRMIASGMSNESIAQARGSSDRAVSKLIARTYEALGVAGAEGENARILAIKMLEASRVIVDE